MLVVIVSSIWTVILVIGGVIAFASRTGPEEAIKNLSLWLEGVGVSNPRGWLVSHWNSRRFRVVGVLAFGALLAAGIFTGGMVVGENLSTKEVSGASRPTSHWMALSDKEALALREEFRRLADEKLSVLCAIPACSDLAESIFDVAHGLNWPGLYQSNYFMDSGIQPGIQIWSYARKEKQRDRIAAALERATGGRLKVSSHKWPDELPSVEIQDDINLVVGRMK